jgi:hypothetical protein
MTFSFMNKITFAFGLGLFLLFSCSSTRKAPIESLEMTKLDPSKTLGKVIKTDSCGFFLEVLGSGDSMYLLPLNLPNEYEKQGVRIQFTYVLSRAKQPSGCLVNKVVTLENIEKVNP